MNAITNQPTPNAPVQESAILKNAAFIKKAMLTIRAINSSARQKIIQFIDQRGKTTVTDLYTALHLDQPIASRHLAILRGAKIVKTQRDGKFIYYMINHSEVEKVLNVIKQLHNEE